MKVLISACIMGKNVRWNGANKTRLDIVEWASKNNVELVPVCPEDQLFGTPRAPIRLVQIEDKVCAQMKGDDVSGVLDRKCKEICNDNKDAIGFIGISKSPTCGMSVGVKNLGGFVKGAMHKAATFPTTECNHLGSDYNKDRFLKKMMEHLNDRK